MDLLPEEIEYRWLDAAKSYEQKLHSRPDDIPFTAECWDKIGYCYSLASRQAKDLEEFKNLRQQAVTAYETAARHFGENPSFENQGRSAGCLAIAKYTQSWLSSNSSEKKKMLDECLAIGKKALEMFKKSGDTLCKGKTCNTLSFCLFDRLYMAPTLGEKRRIAQEGMDNASDAISTLSKLESRDEFLIALSLASLQSWYLTNISEQEEERKSLASMCLNYSNQAVRLSKEVNNRYSKAMSMWAGALSTLFFTEKIGSSLQYAKEMVEQASVISDNYFKGIAYYLLAFITDWMVPGETDQDKKKQKYEDIIRYAVNSIRSLQLVCQDSAIAETYLFVAQSYSCLAREFALPQSEKLAFSKKAVGIGEEGLEYAIHSGSPEAMGSTLHALSKAFHYYSNLETRKDEKVELLRNGLARRKEYVSIVEKVFTSNFWMLGVGLVYAAQIEADLAEMEKDEESKAAFLKEAVSDMEQGVSHCNDWVRSSEVPSLLAIVAGFEDACGGLLNKYYSLTEEKENLAKANKIYSSAAEKFKRVDLPSRVAESYWNIARNLDLSGDYQKAAENFENAFAGYKAASEKIPTFSEFYLDYATYMKVWSEIQIAKLAHCNEKYASAMQHYERASNLLKQSKLWSYLSSNFHAWAYLELAEDFSRKENCKEAINSFEQAIKLFQESERTLRAKLDKIDKIDEKGLVTRLIKASSTRKEYILGRIEIEEAKILDKQGDHATSSAKYEAAAATFQKVSQADPEQYRKEVKPLIYLCQAWQKMTMAEAKNSPILYEEAAELFKLANQFTPNESASLLALAHSSFCKALKSGTEFEITRNVTMYTETKKHMDAAATYYLKAGFETASEYAKATQRLFDAYVYMNNAKRETDPEKEVKYYLMAEKVLLVSVKSYAKANHFEKTDQIRKLLKKVREERELALSLSEILHAPTIASSTASFSTISPSEEKAVGLERFEHADIQAKLIQYGKGIRVGEDASFGLQIVNVGKEPVFLTKVESILPEGFQFAGKPDNCAFEDASLIVKGNRLDPLKTEELKLSFKPFKKVDSEIKPRLICVDETGRQMLYDLEPKVLSVSKTALPGRVTTGYGDLDDLLFGGLPENYAVVLASPSCNERQLIIEKFLKAGTEVDQITFYVTMEPGAAKALVEAHHSSFYLFICNPRADVMLKDLPNVFKLRGVESLTDIDIALTKCYRTLEEKRRGPKRACIEIISDILLEHHAVITGKWLSALLPDLRSKGFTTLAVINPQMHPPEEVQAILGLFEGEIRVSEKETTSGTEKVLRVRKLYNQKYLETELTLTREIR